MLKRVAIIMAGGAGERFWPLSRAKYPKQLLKFAGNRSMLTASVERIEPLVGLDNIFVVTGRSLKDSIEAETNLPAGNVIAEPEGKNTAAALALAAAFLDFKYGGDDVVTAVLTADHFIGDTKAFGADFEDAFSFAETTGGLVTFGIQPDRPETGYGYVELGEPAPDRPGIWKVRTFREKPDLPTARQFFESKRFLWNSGMFVWRNSAIKAAFKTYLPATFAQMEPMRASFSAEDHDAELTKAFEPIPKISIDYGVLEKADNVSVKKVTFDWDDIGTWSSLRRLLEKDDDGNVTFGNAILLGSQNCVAYSVGEEGGEEAQRVVIGFGLRDIVVVNTKDAVLVLPADCDQQVKEIVTELRKRELHHHL